MLKPRFARQFGLFLASTFNLRSNSKQKVQSFCLALLGIVCHFGFGLCHIQSQNLIASTCLRSAIWFNLDSISDSNLEQKFEGYKLASPGPHAAL